jgi:hypothetical protein
MKKAVLIISALLSLAALPLARADVMPNLTLPPMNAQGQALGSYSTPEQYHALYDNVFRFPAATHANWVNSFSLPALGFTATHSFNSTAYITGAEYSPNGGATWLPVGNIVSSSAFATVKVTCVGTLDYSTEMLGLDITASSPLGPVMIRESPTLASTGHTTLTPVTGGYTVNSFFDIYTEISLDGGMNWIPDSLGPTLVQYACPEPSATAVGLLGLALAGLFAIRRRGCKA